MIKTIQRQLHSMGPGPSTGADHLTDPLATSLNDPIQASGDLGGGDLQQMAAHGVSGSSSALPHLDTIQSSFGVFDVSGISAHSDGAASSATAAMGAEAYATGSSVAFGASPSLHTAAHEAAHVVQQRAGVSLYGGLGQEGDAYEQHADAVADAVVRGESAEPLLAQMASPHAASQQQGPVQRATKRFKPKETNDDVGKLEEMAAVIDQQTMAGHRLTLQALQANKPDMVKSFVGEGYYTNWVRNPNAMTTGYIIEDYITNKVAGGNIQSQVVSGGARPDFVVTDSDGRRGVVDITSTGEAGHVLDKRFSLSGFAYVGESLYPSINFNNVKASSFELTEDDLRLITESNQRRAKAKFGSKVAGLKRHLGLIEGQSFLDQESAQLATQTQRAINDMNLADEASIGRVDVLIDRVNMRVGSRLSTVDGIKTIIEKINARYEVNLVALATAD